MLKPESVCACVDEAALTCVMANRYRRSCQFPEPCGCDAPLPPQIYVSNSLGCVLASNVCDGAACRIQTDPTTNCLPSK